MDPHDKIRRDADAVVKRLGKTTGSTEGGSSKESKPKPPPRIKVTPRGNLKDGLTGGRIKITKDF